MRSNPFMLLALLVCGGLAQAQSDDSQTMSLSPAAEALPALKHQLLPPLIDRINGNAVVYYGKVPAEQTAFFASREIWDRVYRVPEMTLAEIAGDDVLRNATRDSSIFGFMRLGARCQYADWQIPVREEIFPLILLPDVQQMRQYARLLRARARVQIADRKFSEAVETLQIGFAMSRHLNEAPVVVSNLVGAAIAGMMLEVVQELVQQPGAPNLYWALSRLPDPLIDLQQALETERYAWFFTEMKWLEIEKMQGDEAFWRTELNRLWEHLQAFSYQQRDAADLVYMSVRGYPSAKQRLIESGMTADKVEAMPVPQVLMIDAIRQYTILRDELMKWACLPYHQAEPFIQATQEKMTSAFDAGEETLPLASSSLTALGSAMSAAVRTSRNVAALRVVEAIRMHAAANGGHLPKTLEEISIVPVPLDPSTGKAFQYQVNNSVAELQSPPLNHQAMKWQLQLVR